VSAVLLDDAGIAAVNRDFLGRREPTDVISFRYEPLPGEADRCEGEVLVNVQRAIEEGPRAGRGGASRELALYVAHGCDHLAGSGDETAAARARMRRRERRWLRAAPGAALVDGLLRAGGAHAPRRGPARGQVRA